jgi:glycosyltransferase involved in cell wall biosynthesis
MKTCLLITTFKRPTQLDNSLKRLCNLTLPDEILVVDDGSQIIQNR